MHYATLEVTTTDGLGRIILNRPARRNALSLEALGELGAALLALSGNSDVIVVEGAGPAFSAGHDLNEMLGREADFYDGLFTACTDVMLAIQAVRQPVIAKVHGVASAAGCQLVAACDLAVAADDSRFATPGVRIGLFCSTPMVPLTRAIGRKRSMEMLLTGDPISAGTALDWGLVNRIAPVTDLETEVMALVGSIRRFSPEIIAIGKNAFYSQIDRSQAEAYAITGPIMSANAVHPDAQEGMSAFLQKRTPQWGSQPG